MPRTRVKGTKYNKVSKQQKFILLRLCFVEKKSIHEAATQIGIHYSTAKTIIFFHKRHCKISSSFNLALFSDSRKNWCSSQASYRQIPTNEDGVALTPPSIQIISRVTPIKKRKHIQKTSSKSSASFLSEQLLEQIGSHLVHPEEKEQAFSCQKQSLFGVKQEDESPLQEIKQELPVQLMML